MIHDFDYALVAGDATVCQSILSTSGGVDHGLIRRTRTGCFQVEVLGLSAAYFLYVVRDPRDGLLVHDSAATAPPSTRTAGEGRAVPPPASRWPAPMQRNQGFCAIAHDTPRR
jgi:hypothetical protein